VLNWDRNGLAQEGNEVVSQNSDEIPGNVAEGNRFATQIAALDLTGDGRLEILAQCLASPRDSPIDNAASPSCSSR
jgi:hypothetical protein